MGVVWFLPNRLISDASDSMKLIRNNLTIIANIALVR